MPNKNYQKEGRAIGTKKSSQNGSIQAREALESGYEEKRKDYVRIKIPKYGCDFHTKQRRELELKAFNARYRCRMCNAKENIEIHHLYEYSPKDIIETYEDFLQIPWIPLCKKCHALVHSNQEEGE